MIPAIVLAAGASSRMGRTKALLPLPGGDTFLARILSTLRSAGIEEIVVVVGKDGDSIRKMFGAQIDRATQEQSRAAEPSESCGPRLRGCRLVQNADPSRGQLSSLLLGLDALASPQTDSSAPHASHRVGGVLVTTVDLPLVSAGTVRRVIEAWNASGAPIVRPARQGRHGHPVIFGAAVFDELRSADLAVGARAVLRAHFAEILDVPEDDPGAFEDIDTPADYERLVGRPFPNPGAAS